MTNEGTLDAIDVIFSGEAQLTNEGTIQQNSPTAFKFQGKSELNNNGTVTTSKLHFIQNAEFSNTGAFSNNGDFHVSGDAKVTNGDTTSASATATTNSDWKFSDNAQFINMAVFTSDGGGGYVTCKDSCVFRNKHHFLVKGGSTLDIMNSTSKLYNELDSVLNASAASTFSSDGLIENNGDINLVLSYTFKTLSSSQTNNKGTIDATGLSAGTIELQGTTVNEGYFTSDASVTLQAAIDTTFSNKGYFNSEGTTVTIEDKTEFTNSKEFTLSGNAALTVSGKFINTEDVDVIGTATVSVVGNFDNQHNLVVTSSSSAAVNITGTLTSNHHLEFQGSDFACLGTCTTSRTVTFNVTSVTVDGNTATFTHNTAALGSVLSLKGETFEVTNGGTLKVDGEGAQFIVELDTANGNSKLKGDTQSTIQFTNKAALINYETVQAKDRFTVNNEASFTNKEEVTTDRRRNADVPFDPVSLLHIDQSSSVTFDNAIFANEGKISNLGTLTFTNKMYENNGLIENGNSLFVSLGGLTNKHTIDNQVSKNFTVKSDASFTNEKNLTNLGTFTCESWKQVISGTSISKICSNEADFINAGTVEVKNKGVFVNSDTYTNDGTTNVESTFRNDKTLTNNDAFNVNGKFLNTLTFDNNADATFTTSDADAKSTNEGILTNIGTISVENSGSLVNAANGIIVNNKVFDCAAKSENLGTIVNMHSFSTSSLSGAFTNKKTVTNQAYITVGAGSTFDNSGVAAILKNFASNGTENVNARVKVDGTLENTGKIENDQIFLVTSVFNNGGVFINANEFTVENGNTTNKKGAQMTLLGKDRDTSGKTCTGTCKGLTTIAGSANLDNQGTLLNQGTVNVNVQGTLSTTEGGDTTNEGSVENRDTVVVSHGKFLNSGVLTVKEALATLKLNQPDVSYTTETGLDTKLENTGTITFESCTPNVKGFEIGTYTSAFLSVIFENTGTVNAQRVTLGDASIVRNNGVFILTGTCKFSVLPSVAKAAFLNGKTLTFNNGQVNEIRAGTLSNSAGGLIEFQGNSQFNVHSGASITNNGDLQVGNSSKLKVVGSVSSAGSITVDGTLKVEGSNAKVEILSGTLDVLNELELSNGKIYNEGTVKFGTGSETTISGGSFYNWEVAVVDSSATSFSVSTSGKVFQQGRMDFSKCTSHFESRECHKNTVGVSIYANPNLALLRELKETPSGLQCGTTSAES
jgi:hypothetical protein